ncbi:MAG: DUF1638 domain-containing protein [Verrucomicrobiia bacterium]
MATFQLAQGFVWYQHFGTNNMSDAPPSHAIERGAGKAQPPRIAVITCAVLEIEFNHFAQGLDHVIRVEVLEQGLHQYPDRLRRELQAAIDRVEADTDAEAIVLGYGVCSRGSEGVRTRRCKLVMARAHDCITHLLGCKERYARYVAEHPGTYWYSPGWNRCHTPPGKERYDKLFEEYCSKYGEDNAKFLMETEQHWFKSYDRATYVDVGVGATPEDVTYTQQCAAWLGWKFDRQDGDPGLLRAMLVGDWDNERFVVLEPGQTFRMTADARVIEPADGTATP